jgi:hypothetical protein
MRKRDLRQVPVQDKPCKSCPFALETPIQLSRDARRAQRSYRMAELTQNLMGNGSHLCHSVKNSKICRGAREIQLRYLFLKGLLPEPTDEAFNQAVNESMENKD